MTDQIDETVEAKKEVTKAARKGKEAVGKQTNRLEVLKVTYVPIGSIEPNAYNPNRQTDRDHELLKRSMREDGFTQPVIVQQESKQIVDGEHRWRAAKVLAAECAKCERDLADHPTATCSDPIGRRGFDPIPVVFVDMTIEQMRISTLRHNRARGSEDFELGAALMRDLRELGALDWAADSLMLDDKELTRLLDDTPVPEVLAGEDFSEAWEPAIERPNDAPAVEARTIEFNQYGAPLKRPTMVAASPDAMARIEAAQAALDASTNGSERYQLIKARQVWKLSLSFTGEEAKIVRQALGNTPAIKVLELCRAAAPHVDGAVETTTPDPEVVPV